MRIYKILFLILALFSLSCSDDLKFINPFDPSSDPSLWAPKNLLIEPQSSSSIKVSWTKVNARYDGFKISRKVGNGEWENDIAKVSSDIVSWIDTKAPYGTTYTYSVRAYAGDNQSNAIEKTEVFALSAPTNLSIMPQSATSLRITWTDTNQFEQGYKISRKVGDGEWQANIAVVGADSTVWVDDDAPYGTTYTYRVRAYAGANYSSSVDMTEEFVLSAPGNLILTPQSATSIKLNWTDTNEFEQGYKISRKVGNGEWQANIAVVGANRTTWIDDEAPIGNTYTYRLRAYAGANYSSSVDKTMEFVLSAPADLTITPQSAGSLKLAWTDTNDFEEGYKISRKVGDGEWQENIVTVGANAESWIDLNAPYGTTYTYRVRAYAGNNLSNAIGKTELFELSVPTNLSITPQSASSLKLSWTDTNKFEEGYKISRKVDNGEWQTNIATVGANAESWTDLNAPYGTTYTYSVRAYAGNNLSNAIEKTEVFALSAPTNLSITPQSASSLKLTWTDTNKFEQGYKISRKVGDSAWQANIAVVGANSTVWIDDEAPIGNTYTYRVRAYAGANYSSSVDKTEEFVLSAPADLTVTPQSVASLKLTWTDTNDFEEGYKISRKVEDGDWEEDIATVDANITQWIDNSINVSQVYQYRLRAYNQSHYSAYSNIGAYLKNFVFVQGGTFQMGSNVNSDEQPIHSVTLSSFWIDKYELTQSEWQAVMTGNNNGISANPSYFAGNPNRPVERVSWYAAIVFCNRKSIQEGLTPCYAKSGNTNPVNWGTMPTSSTDTQWDAITCNWSANGYRLPTEAEWEYAARGGNQSNNYTYSGSNNADDVAWHVGNSWYRTHDVGSKAPNELGIYDMSGNVWEWCWDWYDDSYYSSSPSSNPRGPNSGSSRVLRGGCWCVNDGGCRVACRGNDRPGDSDSYLGLRVLRTIQ